MRHSRAAWLWDTLHRDGEVTSLAYVVGRDGRRLWVEFRTTLTADADRYHSFWREVELDASPTSDAMVAVES